MVELIGANLEDDDHKVDDTNEDDALFNFLACEFKRHLLATWQVRR